MRGTIAFAIAVALASAGCHSGQAPLRDNVAPSEGLLLPGSSLLTPPPLTDTTVHLVVYLKRGDSAERKMADTRRELHAIPGRAGDLMMTTSWDPPYTSLDTIVIMRRGLAPINEHLVFRGTFDYRYDRNRVWGTAQPHDSAQRPFDHTFPNTVFAFQEVELLARSLPFRKDLNLVVPLFSEVDRALEMDTLTVLGPDSAAAGAWVVRFADPVIVSRYVIDRTSRAVISSETSPRGRDMRMRYVPS